MSHNTLRLVWRRALPLSLFGVIFVVGPVGAAEKIETNLEKAMKSGKKHIVFSGKENDDITIKAGVSVTGVSVDKAIIADDIKMENGSSLKNVTVSGEDTVITIAKGASVTLTNVTVRGGKDVGIYVLGGGGTLTVINSRITNNRKGLYILPGKNLNLSGNVISGNDEEGLDARDGTSGRLMGNQFIKNGEGGAEIIAGGTDLKLSGNTFANNKSSGLAVQSYRGRGKQAGRMLLQGNTFANNGDYGIRCISPSKGGAGGAFYQMTVRAIDNTFRGNGRGTIAPECAIANRSSAVAAQANAKSNREAAGETEGGAKAEGEPTTASLPQEARVYFEETVQLLHAQEALLEETLRAYDEATPWWKRLFRGALEDSERDAIVDRIATINELRDTLANFPAEFTDAELDARRPVLISRSLERMEELRQYFERLQKPVIRLR